MKTFKVTEADERYPCKCPKDVDGNICHCDTLVVGWAIGAKALESKLWKWITMRWKH